jgi:hypothetical protein
MNNPDKNYNTNIDKKLIVLRNLTHRYKIDFASSLFSIFYNSSIRSKRVRERNAEIKNEECGIFSLESIQKKREKTREKGTYIMCYPDHLFFTTLKHGLH